MAGFLGRLIVQCGPRLIVRVVRHEFRVKWRPAAAELAGACNPAGPHCALRTWNRPPPC